MSDRRVPCISSFIHESERGMVECDECGYEFETSYERPTCTHCEYAYEEHRTDMQREQEYFERKNQ